MTVLPCRIRNVSNFLIACWTKRTFSRWLTPSLNSLYSLRLVLQKNAQNANKIWSWHPSFRPCGIYWDYWVMSNPTFVEKWLFLILFNPKRCGLLGGVLFREMKFVFIKFSLIFKWRSKYFIWKLRYSANFWQLDQCFYIPSIAARWH